MNEAVHDWKAMQNRRVVREGSGVVAYDSILKNRFTNKNGDR